MWRMLYDAYAWFVAAFRAAAEKLRAGDRAATLPSRKFPARIAFRGWMTAGRQPFYHQILFSRLR
jgi:hypothetical protein